ncbi:multidrug effflux MFS transporter [Neorhizobium galegae]|uniref:multidrug effflux MFS transporter n=1 Tax=Neorhizobium galegae TaxID=399 RepID=UPI000622252C|nr:multidrug effflux MFS transporter [Neorhizobium galegae]CDZ27764.1 Drug resistance transporter, Bcr/CflA family [Neorhizobium galegae bv. officinalis]KAA9386757.1 multidrug effflux MFS transporter [Neorhizobium galegae]KAB1109423.1 multidrug effflux MFS transporter [Neorhizobium galegae]MCM2501559.1 multidrug effflux MFS transporter [Neorhizobium galegae]MCQ1772509.1 multidrug effflux MFS transporter [Neorhizobium galegae]
MQSRAPSHALSLGLLSAIGLFALDMYLPALPTISANLNADSHEVQASLISFFVAMAVSQIAYGPLSDMFGRKKPLYVGLALYAIGAVGCALSPSIEWLIAFRFLQGMGACAGVVISRAIVRDLHTGPAAAQLMSRLMLVFSVSPILAPLAGSIVTVFGDWRLIFWVMVGAGAVGAVVAVFFLEETRLPAARSESSLAGALRSYGTLLRDPYYLGLVLIASFGMSSYMIYVANSSFVLIEHYGLSPTFYSIVFSCNAVAFIGMSQLNGWLSRKIGLRKVIRGAVFGYSAMMVMLALVTSLGVDRLDVMAAFLFGGYGFLGMIIPTAAVLALEHHGRIAGTASAMMGTIQFVTSAVVIGLGGLFFDGTSLPMVTVIALCSVVVFLLSLVVLRSRQGEMAAAAE